MPMQNMAKERRDDEQQSPSITVVRSSTSSSSSSSNSVVRGSSSNSIGGGNSNNNKLVQKYYLLLSTPDYDTFFILFLLLVDCCLCFVIIQKISYTEIDWKAYMEEVTFWYNNQVYDYSQIYGGTGPLVYPAGFVYLFTVLKEITNNGTNIRLAQYIFTIFYLCTIATILVLSTIMLRTKIEKLQLLSMPNNNNKNEREKKKNDDASSSAIASNNQQLANATIVWTYRIFMIVCCLSKRLHSIFILRLFNDGVNMLLCYLAILFFVHQYWKLGCLVFSLSVSIKMNTLLFAPGLLLLLLQSSDDLFYDCIVTKLFGCCALPQLILGMPFLVTYPISYLTKAFEFSRVFFYKWTVNWKCVSEELFLSKSFALLLLLLHISCLVYFFVFKWYRSFQLHHNYNNNTIKMPWLFINSSSNNNTNDDDDDKYRDDKMKQQQHKKQTKLILAKDYIIYTMFVSNFVGIAFIRTLHYQFYSWYILSIPMILCENIDFRSYYAAAASNGNTDSNFFAPLIYSVFPRVLLFFLLEYSFNIFPATFTSSLLLQISHLLILLAIKPLSTHPIIEIEMENNDDDLDNKKKR